MGGLSTGHTSGSARGTPGPGSPSIYSGRNRDTINRHKAIARYIRTPTTKVRDCIPGIIYVAKEKGSDLTKVGYCRAERVDDRLEEICKGCEVDFEDKYVTPRGFRCAYKAEQIVHKVLGTAHFKLECKCSKDNGEWHDELFDNIIRVVHEVYTWMILQRPYNRKTGQLKDRWCRALKIWLGHNRDPNPLAWHRFFVQGLQLTEDSVGPPPSPRFYDPDRLSSTNVYEFHQHASPSPHPPSAQVMQKSPLVWPLLDPGASSPAAVQWDDLAQEDNGPLTAIRSSVTTYIAPRDAPMTPTRSPRQPPSDSSPLAFIQETLAQLGLGRYSGPAAASSPAHEPSDPPEHLDHGHKFIDTKQSPPVDSVNEADWRPRPMPGSFPIPLEEPHLKNSITTPVQGVDGHGPVHLDDTYVTGSAGIAQRKRVPEVHVQEVEVPEYEVHKMRTPDLDTETPEHAFLNPPGVEKRRIRRSFSIRERLSRTRPPLIRRSAEDPESGHGERDDVFETAVRRRRSGDEVEDD